MSEPSQLVVRLRFGPGEHERFLDHVVQPAASLGGWDAWLSAARFHGDVTPAQIMAHVRDGMRVRDWIADLASDDWFGAQIDEFSAQDGVWAYAVHGFAGNYRDFAEGLNVLRQAQHCTTQTEPGYLAIVDAAFGPGFAEPRAVVELMPGASRFLTAAPQEFVAWATVLLERLQALEDARD